MTARNAKQILYYHNAVPQTDKLVVDTDGNVRVPEKDEVVQQAGKLWKVVHVLQEIATDGRFPVFKIYLQEIQSR